MRNIILAATAALALSSTVALADAFDDKLMESVNAPQTQSVEPAEAGAAFGLSNAIAAPADQGSGLNDVETRRNLFN